MNWLMKIIDLIGGFDGIKKVFDGKKTYISAVGTIFLASGWLTVLILQWTDKQINVDVLFTQGQVCVAAIGVSLQFIFQRMAVAKAHSAVQNAQDVAALAAENQALREKLSESSKNI